MAKTSKEEHTSTLTTKVKKTETKVTTSWEERLAECRAFRQAQGHCKIPTNGRGKEETNHKKLGIWVQEQRRNYKLIKQGKKPRGKLSDDRIAQLDEIGFDWGFVPDPKTTAESSESWQTHLAALQAYYNDARGNFDVPLEGDTLQLGRWVRAQRHFNKLRVSKVKCFGFSTGRYKALHKMGLDWDGPRDF